MAGYGTVAGAAPIGDRTFLCADGARLPYSSAGSGQPVVLIHGLGLDAAMWDPQWQALQQEFRVIRYDIRGFGNSTLPTGPYSHSDDLAGLLDFLEARPAHVVGLSMGGSMALRFALEQPGAVRSLTLIDAALEGFSWSETWIRRMKAIQMAARNGDVEAAKQLWLAHELFAPAQRDPQLADRLRAMIEGYSAWHWHNADPVRKAPAPAIRELARVAHPTLVLVGELDLADFQDIARLLAAGIPHAVLRTIAGAGHMANMEAPAAVNALLLAHLRACAESVPNPKNRSHHAEHDHLISGIDRPEFE
jgi:3-oxoadipate enol-lactonase